MAETALNFGPDWNKKEDMSSEKRTFVNPTQSPRQRLPVLRIRALSHGPNSTSLPPPPNMTAPPRYSLAQYRYGREEMLALIPKDPQKPDCLKKDTSKVVRETFTLPLALTPHTEDEQRLWSSRSVNSDAVLRASGKSVPGNNMGRNGRGGSVDRGRGRGRGGYYQRGITYEENEDGPPSSFSRPKPIERSQSASEKDQRWDDRDRRFDRPYTGRGGGTDDSVLKSEQSHWRKFDKDDDPDWRSNFRSSDKLGSRGSWRNPVDKERRDGERNPSRSLNGNVRSSHAHQKNLGNNHLPEWSVDESNEQDVVGTFDSSGAFLEPKMTDNSSLDEIYVSDEADEGNIKESPEAKKEKPKRNSKKSNSPPETIASVKQNMKQTELIHRTEDTLVDKHPPKSSEPHTNSVTVTSVAVNKTADHVIKSNNIVQHRIVNSKSDYIPVTLPNVPDVAESTKKDTVIRSHNKNSETSVPSAAIEEDTFAHHKKATENMVAQWTEEEEQRVIAQTSVPVKEEDIKWYYQDPQGDVQGPFTSPEMLEWFRAGYFTMSLMVRRAFDEKFSQLGELIKSWGRVPFMPGNSPPPIRVTPTSIPNPVTQTIVPNVSNSVAAPVTSQLPKQEDQLLALQQQLLQQQLMQQQLMLRQAQMQTLLAQLKQQDNFTSLNTQQQQQVLMQQFVAQQQLPRPNLTGGSEQPNLIENMTPLPLPLLGLPIPPLLKNDMPFWNMTQPANPWPVNVNVTQPSSTSIWDIDPKPNSEESELEKQKRLVKEQEQLRKAEEERLAQEKEMEEKRKLEELRKQEEERILKELQKQEEDKKKREEQMRKEEENRRQEELKRIEEQKRKEEQKHKEEELRKQREEELRLIEEQKRLEELRKQQEEQKRQEELRRKEEEERRLAELLRRQEEQRKLEEKRMKEELQKKIELEKERERIELEKQKEAARLKEIEREQQLQRERQKQREREEEARRLAEIKMKSQGPAWGIQKTHSETQLSLADIQRLQEEKEREEREERIRQQLVQQQVLKQATQNKNCLSWAKRSSDSQLAVKSLAEIQQEEAERFAQQQRNQKPQTPAPVNISNVGVWGNSSHLSRITAAPPSWSMNSVTTSGFWDDSVSSSQTKKQTSKANDSAFPALMNHEKPATSVQSNKNKNVRAKKEEDVVAKLFASKKPTDEFTVWCIEALSAMPSSVDVPTFVAFLKDIESPYEIYDYVKSYLGDGKEPREFAKQFLERRSQFRAKQMPAEDNTLWGPAPAVNPVVNKTSSVQLSNDNDGNSNAKGKAKRRKNRMQKMDSSMLGFTVQSNPDRLNVGEIDHVEGM